MTPPSPDDAAARERVVGSVAIDDRLIANLDRLRSWCRHQDPNATIWLHIDEAIRALRDADRQRRYAIEWANRSVESIKEAMWEAQDALHEVQDEQRLAASSLPDDGEA